MTSSSTARRSRRTTTVVLGAAVAAALLAAAGCSSSASAEGAVETEASTYAGGHVAFGTSHTYGNGLVVEVKKPARYAPTDLAEGVDDAEGDVVRLRVNVINGSSQEFTPDTVGVHVESAGQPGAPVIDPGASIALTGPDRPLSRGGVVAFDLAFVVADADDVTVTLDPALAGYEPLVFTAG